MVRILANGEIVQDNDPRVQQNNTNRNRFGGINTNQQHQEGEYQQGGGRGEPTIFDKANQKLLDMGIPRWNVGTHVVEPIMTVMVLVMLLMFGVQGLIFAAILYFVVQSSQGTGRQPQRRRDNPRDHAAGSGMRLGR